MPHFRAIDRFAEGHAYLDARFLTIFAVCMKFSTERLAEIASKVLNHQDLLCGVVEMAK